MRHVLSALVQNVPGVLAHVSGMLASRGYNITSLAVGEKPILFGAGNRYIIRDVAPVRVLRLDELNALSAQTTFVAFSRSDGAPLIAEETADEWAVKAMEMPA